MQDLLIIKIGGNVINDDIKLQSFLSDFAKIKGNKILVHGGGKLATELSAKMGIESKMIGGRRVTDAATLKIVTMVYGGYINKNIVASLQKYGCNAIGMTGADGKLIKSHKRNSDIDFGYVGDIDEVNGKLIQKLIELKMNLVVAPITADLNGQLLNTNADTIVSAVAIEMSNFYAIRLVYVFEKKGLLQNIEDDTSVIHSISIDADYNRLVQDGTIVEGMLVKTHNIAHAIKSGVQQIALVHHEDLIGYLKGEKHGTTFKT